MKKIRLSFFFDTRYTNKWDWESFLGNEIGMNGTSSQYLLLVNDLANSQNKYNVDFYCNDIIASYKNINCIYVEDIIGAINSSYVNNSDLLIINNKFNNLDKVINKINECQIKTILWDQNGPSPEHYKLIGDSDYIKRVICVSKTHGNTFRHTSFFSKLTYIYNGRDYNNQFTLANKTTQNIFFIGAINDTKGFHWVSKAWPDIRKQYPSASLTVIGSIKTHDANRPTGDLGISDPIFENQFIKPYLGNTLNEIRNNGVVFKGNISPAAIFEELKNCNLGIVNPNTNNSGETFCVSAIDFQSMGIPVIGGKAGGLLETVINKETGILLKRPDHLAKKVVKYFKLELFFDKQKIQNFVKESFSRKNAIIKWENEITNVLNDIQNKPLDFNFKDAKFKDFIKEGLRIKKKWLK